MARSIKKATSLALAAGIAFGGGGLSVLAPIATVEAQAQSARPEALPDFTQRGTLTIEKKLNNVDTPLQGVDFKISRLDINLQEANGFKEAATITPDQAKNRIASGEDSHTHTITTNPQGEAVFNNLPLGVYLVEETNVLNAKTSTGEAVPNVVKGADFVVTVPITKEDGTGWNYSPRVQPKNSNTVTTKQVTDADKNQDDQITYEINATAPQVPEGEILTSYEIQDVYNDTELRDVSVQKVSVGGADYSANTDYEVPTSQEAVNQPADGNALVSVKFTQAGLQKLSASGDKNVKVELSATIGELGDGEIKNNARSIVRGPRVNVGSVPTETPWSEVVTYQGKLRLNKVNGSENNAPLSGAEFDLYRCTAEGELQGDVIQKATSDGQGIVNFGKSLHVTDFENNAEVTNTAKRYCAVETKAPNGFQLLSDPVVIEFKRADLTEQLNDRNIQKTVTVENYNRPVLPATGGAGIIALILVGLGVIGGGLYWARRNSKTA